MGRIFLYLLMLGGCFINTIAGLNPNDELLTSVAHSEKIAKIDEAIRCESQQIHDLQNAHGLTDKVLWLYNDLGISYFFKEEYSVALDQFDYILQQKYQDEESLLIGAALWGKALCHACLDMSDDMLQDLQILESYFSHLFRSSCRSAGDRKRFVFSGEPVHYSNLIMQTKNKPIRLDNPNENISAAQCRDRVGGTARTLKEFIAPFIKDVGKQIIFIQFINGLEIAGMDCCRDGSIWASCVMPLLQKLENWKVFGIPADPAWD